jgi:hypothetical protein
LTKEGIVTTQEQVFKTCRSCGAVWPTRGDFLADPAVELNGYQVSLVDIETGLLLFTHMEERCRSTTGVPVREFLDLYSGERYEANKALTPECPRYCVEETMFDRCAVLCECAFVREILQEVRKG